MKEDVQEWKASNTSQHNDIRESIDILKVSLDDLKEDWTLAKGKLIGYGTVAGIIAGGVISLIVKYVI